MGVAAELDVNSARRLCLLRAVEAGPPDDSIWIHIPIGYYKLYTHDTYNWRFESEPVAGLNGRTTMFDDYSVAADRNGVRTLPTILATFEPIDVVVFMLGSNDLKTFISGSAIAVAQGVKRLVEITRGYAQFGGAATPDIVIVSPGAPVRRGDRVVAKTIGGEVLAQELKRQTAKTVELKSLNPAHPDRTIPLSELRWIARIVWSSQ